MSNKVYAGICILVVAYFSLISFLKEEKTFTGEVLSSQCIETAKSTESVEVILSDGEIKKRFSFGLKNYVCGNATTLFTTGANVIVSYRSLKDRFVSVNEVYLNGKKMTLRWSEDD